MLTEKLINLVKSYPVLYNLCHEDYKNIRKKDRIWEEIGLQLNESGDAVKKKWKNLRDTFARYIRTNKTKTGQAVKKSKKWQWAAQMDMFTPFLQFAKTTSNITEISNDKDDDVEDFDDFDDAENINPINSLETAPSPQRSSISTSTPLKNRKRHVSSTTTKSSVESLIEYFEIKKQKTNTEEIDLLFKSYAASVRKFSRKRQAITKMKISKVLMEQELLHLEEEDQSSSTSRRNSEQNVSESNSQSNSTYEDYVEYSPAYKFEVYSEETCEFLEPDVESA